MRPSVTSTSASTSSTSLRLIDPVVEMRPQCLHPTAVRQGWADPGDRTRRRTAQVPRSPQVRPRVDVQQPRHRSRAGSARSSGASSRCSAMPCWSAGSRTSGEAGRVEHAGQPTTTVAADPRNARRARPPPRAGAASWRPSPAACRPPARRSGPGRRSSASTPVNGQRPDHRGGSSDTNVTGRLVGTLVGATTTTSSASSIASTA